MRLSHAALTLGLAVVVVVGACGGTAVIDPPLDDTGNGGASSSSGQGGTTSSQTNPMSTGTSPICSTPPPIGDVFDCNAVATVGSGSPAQCTSTWCDDAGNQWSCECSGDSCVCNYNLGETVCTCILDSGGSFCGGTPSCCPPQFPP